MIPGIDDITPDMYDKLNAEIEQAFDEGCHGNCASCAGDCSTNALPRYAKKLYVVTGGKGGTGKSTVTALLARGLAKKGLKVGVLDADLSGATIPLLLDVHTPIMSEDDKMRPAETADGILVLSYDLVAQGSDEAVIWPGVDSFNVVSYFYTGGDWGELDVMLIDMPAGAGDIPLNLYSAFPVDGTVIVTEPGELAVLPVKRCINLCRMLMSPPVALVENKSLTGVPESGGRYDLPVGCLVTALPLSEKLAGSEGGALPHTDDLAAVIALMEKAAKQAAEK